MEITKSISFYFIGMLLLFSCSSDDPAPNANGESITATVNGIAFNATDDQLIFGALIEIGTDLYTLNITGIQSVNSETTKSIGVGLVAIDFDKVEVGSSWTTVVMTNGTEEVNGNYLEGDVNSSQDIIQTEGPTQIYVRITAIDKGSQLISGEFNFTASDDGITYAIENGMFTNIRYDLID